MLILIIGCLDKNDNAQVFTTNRDAAGRPRRAAPTNMIFLETWGALPRAPAGGHRSPPLRKDYHK